jgi:O-methyltransferase involved in polyketide biosynthesis
MTFDTTKPSVGRIYDYVLGGHHNFEVDRLAAQRILTVFPSYPLWARLNRWFLQLVAERWGAEGHDRILDLGSGMPTQGHFHTALPNARVLYTDHDAMTIAYAAQVLQGNPLTGYSQVDLSDTAELIDVAGEFFGSNRRVAIGCIGVAYFIDDASVAQLMQTLHRWAAPGSVLACSFVYGDLAQPHTSELLENYRRNAGSQVYLRTQAEMERLCAPWRIRESQPLAEMLGMDEQIDQDDREGVGIDMYGMLLEHAGTV